MTGAIGLEGPCRLAGTGGLPCGGILPLGIAGTPAYPPLTQTIFAVAEETGVKHVLYAFNPTTGTVIWSRQVDLPIPSEVSRAVQQRPAPAVANRYVDIGFGGWTKAAPNIEGSRGGPHVGDRGSADIGGAHRS